MTKLPMKCPKCGNGVRVVDTFPTENNEVYRRRRCYECDYAFYTIEYEVECTEALEKELYNTPRRSRHRQTASIYEEKRKARKNFENEAFGVVCNNCKDCLCDGRDTDCKKIQKWVEKQMKRRFENA